MKIEEVSKLKNITNSFYISISHKDSICRYTTPIYRTNASKKYYRPIAVKLYTTTQIFEIYDYSSICKRLLTLDHICTTFLEAFVETFDKEVKSYKISDLTLEQAQEIINNNAILINELNNRLLEEDLLEKLNL